MTKVTQDAATKLWLVMVESPVCGWIVQGEWKTEQEAKADAKNWS